MSEFEFEFDQDDLRINSKGFVIGQAWLSVNDEYDVTCFVSSYRYGNDKTGGINHVPMARLTKKDGIIIHETENWDTKIPEKAIERARQVGEWLAENYEQFI